MTAARAFTSTTPVLGEQYDVVVVGTFVTLEREREIVTTNDGQTGALPAVVVVVVAYRCATL